MDTNDLAGAVAQVVALRKAIDLYNSAIRQGRDGEYQLAEQSLLESGRLFEQLSRLDDAADCALQLGTMYSLQNRFADAERALRAAIDHDSRAPERRTQHSLGLQVLANVHLMTDRGGQGRGMLAEAGALMAMDGAYDRLEVCIENLAVALLFSQECDNNEDSSRVMAVQHIVAALQRLDGWQACTPALVRFCTDKRSQAEADAVAAACTGTSPVPPAPDTPATPVRAPGPQTPERAPGRGPFFTR